MLDDGSPFSIDSATGEVTLGADPDFESQAEYAFTVIATDQSGNRNAQEVSLLIDNLDELAPTFTSALTAGSISELSLIHI